ncbi:hypothetical protein [Cellulomonas sp. URHD0024]|uniref:hypothetical protein n=1 Tax=Cellulomonas sp. URHD0024 TaxID=1302620 RepID=UPI0004210E71|nr:hypothetical protein [Cellulomonas sp. URHD0024]
MVQSGRRELVVRRRELAVLGGGARTTATVGFGAPVLTWADVPAASRRAAQHRAQVIAEQVGTDAGFEQSAHEVTQVLRAWRAHKDRIYVVVADRPMIVGPDGPLPSGPWRPGPVQRYDVVGEPRRRVGWVPPGLADVRRPAAQAAPVGREAVTPSHRPEHAGAANAWTHLPASVREGAERAVPVPKDWLGHLTQITGPDGVGREQSIVVLLRDERCAVVVKATRERTPVPGFRVADQNDALARADWLVEQVTFDVRAPNLLPAAGPRVRLPWQ